MFRDSQYYRSEKDIESSQNKFPVWNAFIFTAFTNDKNKNTGKKQEHDGFIFVDHDSSPLLK